MKDILKNLFKRIVYLISVPKCVYCGERLDFEDECFCKECRKIYEDHKLRNCSRCSKKLTECSCTSAYLYTRNIKKLIKVFRYSTKSQDTPPNYLLYSLKQDGRADVFDFLAFELCDSLNNTLSFKDKSKYIITSCPRRRRAIVEYGYDHAYQIAKRVSKILGIKYIKTLKSNAKKAQKQMRAADRLKNMDLKYRAGVPNLNGYTVILIDDIVTTGATMGSCATLIRGLGTRKIIGASIAIAYKDMYTPFLSSAKK